MNKKYLIGIGAVIIIILVSLFYSKSGYVKDGDQGSTSQETSTQTAGKISTGGTKTSTTKNTGLLSSSNLPSLDFIDKRISLPLSDFKDVKMTIEKVVFGRGESVASTGCSGIPNANFSTYLYPGNVCINTTTVDGSPMGIVAVHLLVENNGNVGFGGNSNLLKLHYLRSDSTGKPVTRFAYPLMGLASYYMEGYSSRKIILSYLVPEDQLIYNFVVGYREPTIDEVKNLNVYDFSKNGMLIDFGKKSITLIK